MTAQINPAAPHHLPPFITAPGETDVLMMVMAVVLVLAVLGVGVLFLRLHTLPERIAHRDRRLDRDDLLQPERQRQRVLHARLGGDHVVVCGQPADLDHVSRLAHVL